jgi:hypothetical protein
MQTGTFIRLVMHVEGQHEALRLFEAFKQTGLTMVGLEYLPPNDCYVVDGWHHAEREQLALQEQIEQRYNVLMEALVHG